MSLRVCVSTPLASVDHDDGRIYCCQGAEGVLSEILVTGCVENVYFVAFVVELHDRSSDRDTALLLDFHPVGGGGFLNLVVLTAPAT